MLVSVVDAEAAHTENYHLQNDHCSIGKEQSLAFFHRESSCDTRSSKRLVKATNRGVTALSKTLKSFNNSKKNPFRTTCCQNILHSILLFKLLRSLKNFCWTISKRITSYR